MQKTTSPTCTGSLQIWIARLQTLHLGLVPEAAVTDASARFPGEGLRVRSMLRLAGGGVPGGGTIMGGTTATGAADGLAPSTVPTAATSRSDTTDSGRGGASFPSALMAMSSAYFRHPFGINCMRVTFLIISVSQCMTITSATAANACCSVACISFATATRSTMAFSNRPLETTANAIGAASALNTSWVSCHFHRAAAGAADWAALGSLVLGTSFIVTAVHEFAARGQSMAVC